MPRYEYECKKHGVFTEDKPLSKYKEKGECPKCKVHCDKVITQAPPKSLSWKA